MSSDEELFLGEEGGEQSQFATLRKQHLEDDLDRMFPKRPRNLKSTLPFHTLYQDLFDPLTENLHKRPSNLPAGRKAGPKNVPSTNPKDVRRQIIERFFSRWRREVGDDVHPAMRLIIPDKDRDRAIYGLKEKALAKYLVKLMKIDKNSDDGFNILNWKLPGHNAAVRNAGDFAGRCYEVLCKRAHLVDPGNMTIEQVNELLDKLSEEAKEENQLPILEAFYKGMNADEMTWLIRIITRSMKIGATERTILNVWHPDAEALFNVSSSLRRVCWDLWDLNIRLENEDRKVKVGQCFLPKLAHQPNMSFTQMVASMKPTDNDPEFWIEEKLDGERMQLHIVSESDKPDVKTFKYCSRHGKDYTYLYGDRFDNKKGALTQYIKGIFKDGVENAIFDGEMITWNVEQDVIVPFGSLKTAALKQQSDSQYNERPFYRIFDILLLNNQDLTRYTLRDRRNALDAAINNMHRRMEILPYSVGTKADDIERSLRDVVTRASEGLVIKNPRTAYVLNQRLPDWVKVKPEYMTEFGESLDCLIIGGYYGNGRRGGELSSFLCGLREDAPNGKKTTKFLSFFKVGGGMTTDDFAKLRHNTEGKWQKYDAVHPPSEHVVLGGALKQTERPDMWIKAEDSIVVEVKAASVNQSEDYAMNVTLRFPRFSRFRLDKDWQTALSVEEFQNVKVEVEKKLEATKNSKMEMSKRKQKTQMTSRKKQVTIAGYDGDANEAKYDAAKGDVFKGLTFYIMTESTKPEKRSKIQLEQMVKEHGGMIVQNAELKQNNSDELETEVVCIAERKTVKVASLEKRGKRPIIKPIWLFDSIKQASIDFARGLSEMVVPIEIDRHIFFAADERKPAYLGQVDQYGDSYARNTTKEEVEDLLNSMPRTRVTYDGLEWQDLLDPSDCPGWMFTDLVLWFDDVSNAILRTEARSVAQSVQRVAMAKVTAQFAGATLAAKLDDKNITHVVLNSSSNKRVILQQIASRKKLPRSVSLDWVEQCWKEHTRIDEERFPVL